MLNKHRYSLGLFWLVSIFIIPLPFIQTLYYGFPALYQDEFQAVTYGTIAYTWMLLTIYLSTKPKWVDRLIGLPEMYMFHGIIGIAAVLLAYLHKQGTQSTGWIKTTGDWAFDIFLGITIYSLIFMAGWLTNRVPILKAIKNWLEKIFKHEISVWLHRLNIVGTVLIFIHVQLISYITSITSFIFLFDSVSLIVCAIYLYDKFVKTTTYEKASLIKNITINDNVQEITVQLKSDTNIDVKPGDYVFLAFPEIRGMKEMHPFSIVNAPDESKRLVIAIRGDGDFTKKLVNVPNGSIVNIDGGYQEFLEEQPKDANIVVIGGGIGVTPLISSVTGNQNRNIKFLYSAHTKEELLYLDHFNNLNNLENINPVVQVGRFKENQLLDQLEQNWQDNTVFLIGGPSHMIHKWKKFLKSKGAGSGQIFYEEFSW